MQLAQGVIILVHEGRFALVKDDGRVMPFLLAHNASLEPQDLPRLTARPAPHTAGRRSAGACRTLDQHGQHRFMVERDAPAWI
jgi:hypothetical protein